MASRSNDGAAMSALGEEPLIEAPDVRVSWVFNRTAQFAASTKAHFKYWLTKREMPPSLVCPPLENTRGTKPA